MHRLGLVLLLITGPLGAAAQAQEGMQLAESLAGDH